jgi:hypothetical protein
MKLSQLQEAKTLSSTKRYSRWIKEAVSDINNDRDNPDRKIKLDYDDVDEAVRDLTE